MKPASLKKDPCNIIITGVGGQGNVMASRVLGSMLMLKGYTVTIGETFGVSQRGGSVMSHLRISAGSTWSPQIPRGKADIIVALEPAEGMRVLREYGNKKSLFLSNTRPIYPVSVIAGDAKYSPVGELRDAVCSILPGARFIDATDEALNLGNPVLGNIVMLGALAGMDILPLTRSGFRKAMASMATEGKLEINAAAFDAGIRLVKQPRRKGR